MRKIGTLCVALALILTLVLPSAAYGTDPVYITGVLPVPSITVDWLVPYANVVAALRPSTNITCSDGIRRAVNLTWVSVADSEYPFFTYHPMSSSYLGYVATAIFELPPGVLQPDPPIPQRVTTRVRQMTSLLPGIYPTVTRLTLAFPGFNQPGTYGEKTMLVGGVNRTHHWYVPTSYDGTRPVPLLVVLHGGGSHGLSELLRADDKAEKYGFIVVCPTDHTVASVSAVIDKMAEDFNIDARRVYVCGISMGAARSAAVALQLTHKVAAVGLVAGGAATLMNQTLSRPMTVIMMGGSKDRVITPIDRNLVPGMLATANWLVPQYACYPDPALTQWEDPAVDPLTNVTRYAWSGGIYGTEVVVYAIWNGGHCWPGGLQYAVPSEIGWVSQHIDALEEMWQIFAKHTLPMEVTINIRPGLIGLKSKGVIPVQIPSTEGFDATKIDPTTVRFGPALARPASYEIADVNSDGKLDMVVRFRTQETGIQVGDTSAQLTGWSSVDGAFFGSDTITVK